MIETRIIKIYGGALVWLCAIFILSSLYTRHNWDFSWIYSLAAFLGLGIMFWFLKNDRLKIISLYERFIDHFKIWHIVAFAFALRILFFIILDKTQESDFLFFHEMALDIFDGKYWLNPIKPTGASHITAFFYWIFVPKVWVGLLPIIIISTLEVYLLYKIVLRYGNSVLAKSAAFIMAICPEQLYQVAIIASDDYYLFFVLLCVYFISDLNHFKTSNVVFAAISLAVAQYMRPTAILVVIPVLFYFIFIHQKKIIKTSITFILLFLLGIAPITIWYKIKWGIRSLPVG